MTIFPIQTYHCICHTHILTTPYDISFLPTRRSTLDHARILPLPSIGNIDAKSSKLHETSHPPHAPPTHLPSILSPNLKPAKKAIVIRREDGYERRRCWTCGRCGLVVGYEVEGGGNEEGIERETGPRGKILYLLEGALSEVHGVDKEQ